MTVTAVPLQPVKRSYLVWLWVGIAVLLLGAFVLARQGDDYWSKSQRGMFGTDSDIKTTASGLQYRVLRPGQANGPKPADTDVALVNYEGKFLDGKTFDKSRQPTPMPVAGVVPGFSEALKLMPKGSKYRIWLPPALAYGEKGAGVDGHGTPGIEGRSLRREVTTLPAGTPRRPTVHAGQTVAGVSSG